MAKILLADDSATARNMGRNILSDAGHEVLTVDSAADARRELPEFQPEMIILDMYMQGGPAGLELCEQLRRQAATASAAIMLAVGKMEAHDPADAERAGADEVIVKPFEATELIEKVKRVTAAAAGRALPDYTGMGPAAQHAQLWPAAAVAKFFGVGVDVGAIEGPAVIKGESRSRVEAALRRVLEKRLPEMIAEVMAELTAELEEMRRES